MGSMSSFVSLDSSADEAGICGVDVEIAQCELDESKLGGRGGHSVEAVTLCSTLAMAPVNDGSCGLTFHER